MVLHFCALNGVPPWLFPACLHFLHTNNNAHQQIIVALVHALARVFMRNGPRGF